MAICYSNNRKLLDHIWSNSFLLEQYLGCFQCLVIMKKATINHKVQFLCELKLLFSLSEIYGSYDKYIINLLEITKHFSKEMAFYHFHN